MEISTVTFCLLIAGIVVVLIFCAAFFIEIFFSKENKSDCSNKDSASAVQDPNEDEELNLDDMLAKLEQKSKEEEKKTEPVKVEDEELNFDEMFAKLEESVKKNEKEELVALSEAKDEKPSEEPTKAEEAPVEKLTKAEKREEKPVEKLVKEEKIENAPASEKESKPEKQEIVIKVVNEEAKCTSIDYSVRLEKLRDSLVKLEKDLAKSTKELNKFERTSRRKAKNERLLDKKAGELANLNLVLYNVNDIKNIDPEKKQKQEELTEHVTELKASITSANEYLASNKEKNANAKKLNSFLTKEKARYMEEIAELETLKAEANKKK